MSPQEVLEFAKKNDARQLDLRFTDIPSLQHHVSYPITQLELDSFEEGFGMDGSSIRGWAAIHESDMLLIPDASTAFMDPFAETPTLVMYGQQDAISDQEAGKFFAALGTGDKALVVLPGGDHAALVEDTHDMWISAIVGFLTRPVVRR